MSKDLIKIAAAQITPVWLDREATLEKINDAVQKAGEANCRLVAFGEAVVPGYPWWLERTNGARFNDPMQKEIYACYLDQAVCIEKGHLSRVCRTAAKHRTAVVLGCVERASDRGGHSLYCSVIVINPEGSVASVHRKLVPTHEERLVWAIGDGAGLKTHSLGAFTFGALNCWENWMPLTRATLYGLGEDLHVAVWPGSIRNTIDITRFIALESRSFVVSASGIMHSDDIPTDIPHAAAIRSGNDGFLADGGSCIAGPDGSWIVEPVTGSETLITAQLDHRLVRMERQNFDPTGHYSRPDVVKLYVNRERQSAVELVSKADYRKPSH